MKAQKQHISKPSRGRLLISEPSLHDFYFKQSVILLAGHDAEGSFGLIINKPTNVKLNEVTNEFPKFDVPLYLGGPVKTDSLFFIHTIGDYITNSLKIMDGLYWGGDISVIKEMITLNQLTPDNIRFFVGYSGWASKQLDQEMEEKSWFVSKTKAKDVIHSNPLEMWSEYIKVMVSDYAVWANLPSDPSMN